ncbi:MAG: hypothetical protein N2512_13715, partial [Armatimonadetes bacterium]|nr:hypothetical protein [Armatimonadota bacterium]
ALLHGAFTEATAKAAGGASVVVDSVKGFADARSHKGKLAISETHAAPAATYTLGEASRVHVGWW